ncbi:glycosyltransferase family 39 protein [Leptolyngbya iicbica LK]|uniref:Glycosyltransferase family 39 protein n=1 Tax=Leptolyngbya iicbica LK TaxID=2294035 RepID=A0A4Q7E9G5_9CYAN|nr:glycosyltransferase family 39 protein [Leptolyngbya sp. LK]
MPFTICMISNSTTRRNNWTCWLLLWGAALLICCIDLAGVPLRDWDEGTVAQVAREMSRGETWAAWLHPQLWGQPYLNKPPLLHSLIAVCFQTFGVQTWVARLPGAILTATSVPMLFLLGREVLPTRLYALMGAGVYLTWLPVVRHGRLAMLDGAVVCFFITLLWLLRRSQRQPWAYLGVGACFAAMCLTKGILGGLLLAIALLWVLWDAPKEWRSPYLWGGVGLGSLPVIGWYALQWQYYGDQFVDVTLLNQNLSRVWDTVEDHQGPPWYYLLELLKYSWPWLIFWPTGLWLTWRSRHTAWAKLILVWTVGYLLTISVMSTKLPWYIYPLYPAMAMTVGVALAATWNRHRHWSGRELTLKRIPLGWAILLALLSVGGAGGMVYASSWGPEPSLALAATGLGVMLTTGLAAYWAVRQQTRFIPILMAGLYASFLALMLSDHWLWELGEAFPVLPVANLINGQVPRDASIYMADFYNRPSLDFYCDRRVVAQPSAALLERWPQETPMYVLTQNLGPYQSGAAKTTTLGMAADWHLVVNQ